MLHCYVSSSQEWVDIQEISVKLKSAEIFRRIQIQNERDSNEIIYWRWSKK